MALGASHPVTTFAHGVVQKCFSDYFEVVLSASSPASWLDIKPGADVDPDAKAYLQQLVDLRFPTVHVAPSSPTISIHSVHDVEQFAADEFDHAVKNKHIFFNGLGRCIFSTSTPMFDAKMRFSSIQSTVTVSVPVQLTAPLTYTISNVNLGVVKTTSEELDKYADAHPPSMAAGVVRKNGDAARCYVCGHRFSTVDGYNVGGAPVCSACHERELLQPQESP